MWVDPIARFVWPPAEARYNRELKRYDRFTRLKERCGEGTEPRLETALCVGVKYSAHPRIWLNISLFRQDEWDPSVCKWRHYCKIWRIVLNKFVLNWVFCINRSLCLRMSLEMLGAWRGNLGEDCGVALMNLEVRAISHISKEEFRRWRTQAYITTWPSLFHSHLLGNMQARPIVGQSV